MKETSIKTRARRVALVTGAGQGIGQEIAVALAQRGARVIATDLKPPQETPKKIGPAATPLQLDVTKEEDWRSVPVKSRELGELDIDVNNAGYFPNRSIDELDLATWRKTMATNLDSRFLSAKYFLPAMRKKKWGRFIGISSNMVGLAIPGMSHYITSKMGLSGSCEVSQTTSQMMALRRTRRCPVSLIRSQRLLSRSQKRATWGQQAITRLGEPEDVTGAILLLASDDAAFITLQAIVVDGGQYRIG